MDRTSRPSISIAACLLIGFSAALSCPSYLWAGCPGAVAPAPASANTTAIQEDDSSNDLGLIVTADFNRDGIPDIAKVVPNANDPAKCELAVLLGQGDGTYRAMPSRTPVGSDPRSLVVGDFNSDGFPDLIVGDGGGAVIELLGDGSGNLAAGREVARFHSAVSIAVGDFNNDGKLDLAVEDAHASSVMILLGSGAGAFRPIWSFGLTTHGKILHLAAIDFNRDGILDLVITGQDEDSFEVMTGNGNGTFTYAPALSHLKDPNAHCVT